MTDLDMPPTPAARACPTCGTVTNHTDPFPAFPISKDRLAELLQSNAPPQASEQESLRTYVDCRHASLAALRHRIEIKRAELASLIDEEKDHLELISQSQRVMHPLRRLPPELLEDMFQRAIIPVGALSEADADMHLQQCDSLSMSHGSWTVSHVCSSWRRISMNCPRVWSQLRLQFDNYNTNPFTLVTLCCRVLENSGGNSPLFVHLASPRVGLRRNPILAAVLSQAGRFVTLHLSIPYASLAFLSHIKYDLGCLTSLYLGQMTGAPSTFLQNMDAFESAPRLATIENSAFMLPSFSLERILLPWSHIKTLNWDLSVSEAMYCLRSAANLETFLIQLYPETPPPIIPVAETLHSRISSLRIFQGNALTESVLVNQLLAGLVLPSLQTLVLKIGDLVGTVTTHSDETFLFPDSLNATALNTIMVMRWGNVPHLALTERVSTSLLSMLRTVTASISQLHLEVDFSTGSFFQGLTTDGSVPRMPFPSLKTVKLALSVIRWDIQGVADAFLSMAASWANSNNPADGPGDQIHQTVTIDGGAFDAADVTDEVRERMAALVERGIVERKLPIGL